MLNCLVRKSVSQVWFFDLQSPELRMYTPDSKWQKLFGWTRHISVEPTMWLYMMAYTLISVVEQAFFVNKACTVDHGFSKEECDNISKNETLKNIVQVSTIIAVDCCNEFIYGSSLDFHTWGFVCDNPYVEIKHLFEWMWLHPTSSFVMMMYSIWQKTRVQWIYVVLKKELFHHTSLTDEKCCFVICLLINIT